MLHKLRTTLAFLLIPAAFALATASAQAQTTVKVSLIDASVEGAMGPGMAPGATMAIRASTYSVPTGKITFEVDNPSKGIEHELLVVAVDDPNAALPYDQSTERAIESKLNVLGDTDVEPGESKKLEVTLPAGRYLLLCNEAGHYKAGMVASFTVTPLD